MTFAEVLIVSLLVVIIGLLGAVLAGVFTHRGGGD